MGHKPIFGMKNTRASQVIRADGDGNEIAIGTVDHAAEHVVFCSTATLRHWIADGKEHLGCRYRLAPAEEEEQK